ncbi:hypothetical protein DERP_012285 [Dermatophagoides pteronyssinus]|uniref:Uncharacterized protein n=1 Tax=Dermatophagoides pteronyssinus TaxID=6956 RepID=A0ABQ8JQE7_DERPT|nr:hypothetical protein DERP_012285 [Dermatophagoides pteronyssinus]
MLMTIYDRIIYSRCQSVISDNHNGKYHLEVVVEITATTTAHNRNQNFIYNLASRISHNG